MNGSYVDIFAKGGPDGTLGKTLADAYQAAMQRQGAASQPAAAGAASGQPVNALAPATPQSAPVQQQGVQGSDMARTVLRNLISHSALLSDTPEKWDATLAMMRNSGIDPSGFEDFEKGRARAVAAAGFPGQASDTLTAS
jgi:hypothetical protein